MNSNLLRLRFKGHELGFNPKSFRLTKTKNIVQHTSPVSGGVLQELGFNAATVTGSGEFYGENAKAQYDELYELFCQRGSGVLHILGHTPFYAYFTSIGALEQLSDEVVVYSFKFVEDCSRNPQNGILQKGGGA